MKRRKKDRLERLGGAMWVGVDIKTLLRFWRGLYGIPAGRALTEAVRFAATHPDFVLKLKGRKQPTDTQ